MIRAGAEAGRWIAVVLSCVAMVACGGPGSPSDGLVSGDGYTLGLRGGTYDAGGGYTSLAVLMTLRDADGRGPAGAWQIEITDPADQPVPATLAYDDGSPGSYVAWWLDGIAPLTGTYHARAIGPSTTLETTFLVDAAGGLSLPSVRTQGGVVVWDAVAGAASYTCTVVDEAGTASTLGPMSERRCDPAVLAGNAYSVAVRAFSADLASLGRDLQPAPTLPTSFDASEARVGLTSGAHSAIVRAAVGAINYGTVTPGLVLWLSIRQADGTVPSTAWTVDVVGPPVGPGSPWTVEYPAGAPQILTWAYDLPSVAGSYSVTAKGRDTTVAVEAALGSVETLMPVYAVTADPSGAGGALVDWEEVPGAKSYQVSVWTSTVTPELAESVWTDGSPFRFAPGTFAPGRYDVYVAATNVAMTNASAPTPSHVAVSENSYAPVSFTE